MAQHSSPFCGVGINLFNSTTNDYTLFFKNPKVFSFVFHNQSLLNFITNSIKIIKNTMTFIKTDCHLWVAIYTRLIKSINLPQAKKSTP